MSSPGSSREGAGSNPARGASALHPDKEHIMDSIIEFVTSERFLIPFLIGFAVTFLIGLATNR